MERFQIPVWINILSVVVSVFLVYLLAKWEASKEERRAIKRATLMSAETDLRSMEKAPTDRVRSREEPVLKKAA
jgi:hypothetical protein